MSGLKLILKVGGSSAASTPERSFDAAVAGVAVTDTQEDNFNSPSSSNYYDNFNKAHKKSKKKKKKKEKDYEKRDKKKKHRKDKKKRYEKDAGPHARGTEAANANETLGVVSASSSNFSFSLPSDEKNENSQESSLGRRRQKHEKTALHKLLEYIHQFIEKKDTQQFFAWPVTDQIAPGYSLVISQPMDLNTMKRNIENGVYLSLPQYIQDLQLMCRNAMVYNRPDTVYYKAAKKLLHAGLKITSADKLRSTPQLLPLLSEISSEELGFDQDSSAAQSEEDEDTKSTRLNNVAASGDHKIKTDLKREENCVDNSSKYGKQSNVELKSEDTIADEILAQARKAAKQVADKLAQKKPSMEMGFLRQKKDGSTTLAIIVPNDGIDPKTRERPILLGSLIGRLSHGTGSLQGFREDKRNFVKTVKPLYYGAFGSYAPSYDSTFANLTKEESQLLFQTYGDETAAQYAESLLNFSKDCDYVTTMVDNLLDIMTGGDHRKTKKYLEERKKLREEEETEEKRLKDYTENKKSTLATPIASSVSNSGTQSSSIKSMTVSPIAAATGKMFGFEEPKIEINQLKTLSEFGIDISFLDYFETVCKEEQKINDKLEQTRTLLERLHQTQYERLSSPLPPHLSQIQSASDTEHQLADRVTESLSNIIKKLPPGNVAPVAGVRKAMGIAPLPQQQTVSSNTYSTQFISSNLEDTCSSNMNGNFPLNVNPTLTSKIPCDEEPLGNTSTVPTTAVTGFDLESELSELREFLENDPALSSFHLPDDVDDTDKTIEQMLSAHS